MKIKIQNYKNLIGERDGDFQCTDVEFDAESYIFQFGRNVISEGIWCIEVYREQTSDGCLRYKLFHKPINDGWKCTKIAMLLAHDIKSPTTALNLFTQILNQK